MWKVKGQSKGHIVQTHFLRMSCFFCSSDVGRPMDFCLWSYIIFSTIPRVSPSRSDSCSGGQRQGEDEVGEGRYCAGLQHLKSYLGVLWADLLGVDLRIGGDDLVPPLHLIDLRINYTFSLSWFNPNSIKGALLLTFSRWTVTTLPSSISQELSSTLTSL